ncbi:hypothetical protein I5Q34_33140 [Streptomyces sp. AV19]|nr:hypothetical protein [Streptomyces sp. AV19]MBH1939049.1 hypothetical protein [Streptomyces sp. AV19]MDG4531604.1 hypothetical protein [Streptomyces sp. AV19]
MSLATRLASLRAAEALDLYELDEVRVLGEEFTGQAVELPAEGEDELRPR